MSKGSRQRPTTKEFWDNWDNVFGDKEAPKHITEAEHKADMEVVDIEEDEGMKTYEAYVIGGTSRRVIIEAKNLVEAELEAIREFTALVGAEGHVEVVDIEQCLDVHDHQRGG